MQQPAQLSRRMSSTSPGQPTSKRRSTACERCNKRRVKCNAWSHGTPCSACLRSNAQDCRLVQSKRSRGSDGRYVLPERSESAVTVVANEAVTLPEPGYQSEEAISITRSNLKAELPLDLTTLIPRGTHSSADPSDSETSAAHDDLQPEASPVDGRANFVGESWYAGYVLSNSAAAPAELHRTMERRARDSHDEITPRSHLSVTSVKRPPPKDLPPSELIERLLEDYFNRFHVYCPIVDRATFLAAVRDGSVSTTLLRCVLFVASVHCDVEVFHSMGYSTRLDAGDDLFGKARASFDADTESDRTTMVLSSYLLHYWFGKPTNFRDFHWYLANAIRSAQCMGYHRNTKHSKMSSEDKARFKIVWWCLYIRDRQVSFSTSTPMVINDLDHDVDDLTVEDLNHESQATANYMLAQMTLNKTASTMYFQYCAPPRAELYSQPGALERARQDIQDAFENWYSIAPIETHRDKHHQLTLIVKVCYHYYVTTVHRRLQRLCHDLGPGSKCHAFVRDAANNISSLLEDSLLYWTPEYFPMIFVTALFVSMTAQIGDNGVRNTDLLRRKLRPSLLALKQFEQCYVTARWTRTLFMDFLDKRDRRSLSRRRAPGKQREVRRMRGESSESPAVQQTWPSHYNSHDSSLDPPVTEQQVHQSPSLENMPSPMDLRSGVSTSILGSFDMQPPMLMDEIMQDISSNDFYLQTPVIGDFNLDEFPSPTTLDYHSLQYLADLGMSGFNGFGN